ncbi:uncharacterized protein Smp_203200 [Schistosoma mansoni]|uniref:Smp_203200 n=1 Tax=Schistosoma mansoni TaxID=6183 RepID=G4VKY9_SCHMA|nr:uncharacterized protein Smp_203200 [Schistosoma mansoni]|eukprot:XP_018653383.1 uncharacterized protein Smp_203200 [Schistosoma mansoni]
MIRNHSTVIILLLLVVMYYISIINIQSINCTTINDLLIYPKQHKKLFKIIHYLIRQCVPYCLNYGKLEKPDMPWKKCYCICPDNYYGIACEFIKNNEEINMDTTTNNNDQLLSNMNNLKSNSLPYSYRRAASSSSSAAAAAASFIAHNNDQDGNDNDQQMIFVK